MGKVKVIKVNENVNALNDGIAAGIRAQMNDQHTLFLNVMSGPGSGKTTLLAEVINSLKDRYMIGEMDVDITTSIDAQRVADRTGVESIQIHNGGLCHIDADMTARALEAYNTKGLDLLILENSGNLVCPAEFDVGAHKNVMLLSVPEGDDKPLKYPLMFSVCDVVLINKIDTLEYFDFDIDRVSGYIHRLNPEAEIFPLSAKTGEGVYEFCKWIEEHIRNLKDVLINGSS